jgi:predicted metal-dependent hydrolase
MAFVSAVVLVVLGVKAAVPAAPAEKIEDRLETQERRIDQGSASGSLTRNEVDILYDNLYWIKSNYARMKSDGRLGPAETRKLDEMLDRNSAMISNKKSNAIARVYRADIPERIADQQWRIDQGIASGALTRMEADILSDNCYWVKSTYARVKSDGRLTLAETRKLDEMLDRNSVMIFNKKNNAIARVYRADIPERIADQQWRVDQGIASGALTRAEADILSDNLYWIKSTYARMQSDGRLNPAETRKLDEMLDRNSAMIFNGKHNAPRRVY